MKRRLNLLILLVLLALAGLISLLYADATGPALTRLKIRRETLSDAGIPASFNGLRLVYFSDLHAFNNHDTDYDQKVFETITGVQPDIILFGGDLIDDEALGTLSEDQIATMTAWLKDLEAPLGKFAVLGEDDQTDALRIKAILTAANFEVLDNTGVLIRNHSLDGIGLVGLNTFPSNGSNEAYASLGTAYTITLAYNPLSIETLDSSLTQIVMAGRTHGGQVVLPFFGASYAKAEGPYLKGRYPVNGMTLDVSSGLGTEESQARWFDDPSITLYTFKTN